MSAQGNDQYQGQAAQKTTRLVSLDALRGLIIVLMALDHANYFIAQKHPPGEHWGGPFPSYNDTIPFLTRFVTHLSAPGFAFLMGAGMFLFAASRRNKGWSEWAITRHFIVRGGFLIVLQFLLINRAWELGPDPFPGIYIGVLVALGGGMILGSFLLRLKTVYLLAVTILLFVGTELTHPDPGQWGQIFDQPLGLLLGYSGGDMTLWSNYPILPWLELITFGMVFGHWLLQDSRMAIQRGFWLGVIFLGGFFVIRYLDGFGNIRPRIGDSWMDFLNPVKYPPSMTFTLLTMGANLVLLRGFAWIAERWPDALKPLTAFGRAPLFFYILHLFLYAGLGLWLAPGGTGIPAMIPYWILGLAILFPACLWYGVFKHRQPSDSLLHFL